MKRLVLRWVVRNCRNRVRDRENLRFERTRLFGRVRMIIVELGHRLHDLGILESPADVFFLEIDEVLGFVEGNGSCCDLKGLSRLRKAEHERWLESSPPADRFETRGVVYAKGNSFRPDANPDRARGEQRIGVGCSPGKVRGTVKIVRSTAQPPLAGSILVAERADPSWILLFPLAAGVILERGSVLSHVSIVGREMRIPIVASLPGLTSWLSDGDVIEMDGATGAVTRVAAVRGESRLAEDIRNSQPRRPSPVSSISRRAVVRYGQCWEDAEILCEALDVRSGDRCLSIGSGGDNTLALLAFNPAQVIAVDNNPAQLACLALRIAAFGNLEHAEVLELLGWRPSQRRVELYRRLRRDLAPAYGNFWDHNLTSIARGAVNIGRFEHYLRRFRKYVLPLIHSEETVNQLFCGSNKAERANFYDAVWDTRRWRWFFKIFFSRAVMQRMGRDPRYFRYAEAAIAQKLLERTRHAMVDLEPVSNPYLQWILRADQSAVLPLALRRENFDALRSNLDRLQLCCLPVEDAIREFGPFDRLNLSDVFESMSPAQYCSVLQSIAEDSLSGTRLVYWNMSVERRRPEWLADRLRVLSDTSSRLLPEAKAFFYRDLVVEEVV
ncbi:MAG TPA: DUF3419 family protein [Terriglobales bacterium]|nr:DUF3419 family protein [Terriglobales bacterium]